MRSYKNDIIVGICGKLQLQSSKYDLANDRYQTIADIIQNDPVFKNIDLNMYPHGSFRLKTTVKPLSGNEYDLDFVVEIPSDFLMSPSDLYDNIYRILSTDGSHNDIVEKKNRCIRVNYANDFHMDIIPGQVFNQKTNEIIVPDREMKTWYHHSNPKRYAEWFEIKANMRASFSQMLTEQAEPIVDQEDVSRLEPLRRATQLVKRYRDIYCDRNNKEPVRSIVLCTLLGKNISGSYSDEVTILNAFCSYVNDLIQTNRSQPFKVMNPVVNELLTEKWFEDLNNYRDFVTMIDSFTSDISELITLSSTIDIGMKLKHMFGESLTSEVIKEHAELISNARDYGNLGVNKYGTLTVINEKADGTSITEVKPNTFYGEVF